MAISIEKNTPAGRRSAGVVFGWLPGGPAASHRRRPVATSHTLIIKPRGRVAKGTKDEKS